MITLGLFLLLAGVMFLGITIIFGSTCTPDNLNLVAFVTSIILLIVGGVLTGYDILIMFGIL